MHNNNQVLKLIVAEYRESKTGISLGDNNIGRLNALL